MKMSAANEQRNTKSVCIVGAGAAGLCALRHFTSRPDTFSPVVCFEQMQKVGGLWNFSEETGIGTNGLPVHSSMYRDLRANLPIEIMAFPDFPVTNNTDSFLHHTEVLKYLVEYSDHFKLLPCIHFEHYLRKVTRHSTNDQWLVTVCNLKTSQILTRPFDILLLCLGRYSKPKWPQIESIWQFSGSVIHSHDYRSCEGYINQRVAVIGGGPSGIDISLQLSAVASEVILINQTDRQYRQLPANIRQINGQVRAFAGNSIEAVVEGIVCRYGIDSVICATGYHLNLGCLDQEACALQVNDDDDTVGGLYQNVVNLRHPSMAILAVTVGAVLPFPLYHQQILYFLSIQLGRHSLPPTAQMLEQAPKTKDRHVLRDSESLAQYVRSLETAANLKPLKPVLLRLFGDLLHRIQVEQSVDYKSFTVQLLDDEEYLMQKK